MSREPDAPGAAASPRRGPTPRGWTLLAFGAAATAAAFGLEERDLLFLGFLGLLMPFAGAVLVGVRRPRVRATARMDPARLVQGESGQLCIRITGARAWAGSLAVWLPEIPGLLRAACIAAPRPTGAMAVEARGRVQPTRRGLYHLRGIVVSGTDPFGLWVATRNVEAPLDVVVLPATMELTELPGAREGREASLGRGRNVRAAGDPDVGVRPYRMGDDVRLIHWSASARLDDELVVRVTEHRRLPDVVMILDGRPEQYPQPEAESGDFTLAGLDVAVMFAASAGLVLQASDVDLALASHGGRVLLDGATAPGELLEALAVLSPKPPRFHPQVGQARDLIIAVVGHLDAAAAGELARQRPPGTPALAFLVTDPFAQGRAGAAREVLSRAGWVITGIDGSPGSLTEVAERVQAAWHHACLADSVRIGAGR